MKWRINKEPISFRGRIGMVRTTRKDEVVIYQDDKVVEGIVMEVLGRKAWRFHENKIVLTRIVNSLNSGKISEMEALESLEWEQKNGDN
jgi:hypothetical protein